MNNVIKSVALAAIVLVAGVVAMQAIYDNVTGSQSADIQPAAGEYNSGMGAADEAVQHTQDTIHDALEEAEGKDALEDAIEETDAFPEQH